MQYGHFDNQNCEYVIDCVNLPTSWTNYLGVEDMTAVINQTAGGYLFYKSAEYHRITRFRPNAVPEDRPGDYVYIRDGETGEYWSVSWQPVGKDLKKAKYKCRHGLSYSVYECDYNKIHASQTMSIPMGENALVWDVKITNQDTKRRILDVFTYAEFSFHLVNIDNQNFQMSLYCTGSEYRDDTILYDLFYEEDGYQYFTSNVEPDGFDTVREAFLGPYRTEENPQAVVTGTCSGSCETGGNHCASLQKKIELEPGETVRLIYFLGEGQLAEAQRIRNKYMDPAMLDKDYEKLRNYWYDRMNCMHVNTPDEGMNTMLNIWTLYQSEINVKFSRFASFIEVGGRTGLGYRDTAQDAMTVIANDPEVCKMRIGQLLTALTTQGYGIHLFEPKWFEPKDPKTKKPFRSPTVIPEPDEKSKVHGIEDACADDALWLVPTIVEFIKETGDLSFANEEYRYANGGSGSVYEHIKHILDFSSEMTGSHGIAKGLRADWNDCLNLGGGESALVSFLLYEAIQKFIPLAKKLGQKQDVEHYEKQAEDIKDICNSVLWDGEWYLRGFTKSGKKIGSHENNEGRIHLESNAWAVLSGCASKNQAQQTLNSIHNQLATPWGILLNAPAYTRPDDEIGFITRVYPGLKENSSIFSHPNPWVWAAECKTGNGERAMEYYRSLTPYYQNDKIEIRYAEPYSYCQFVSGKDHSTYGKAHHPFMTGSGGWAYYAATHYMLGIRPDYDQLVIDPCIPKDWKGFIVDRQWRGAYYHIEVSNHSHTGKGVKLLFMDNTAVNAITPQLSGTHHRVTVVL